jgi:hypothetical protein
LSELRVSRQNFHFKKRKFAFKFCSLGLETPYPSKKQKKMKSEATPQVLDDTLPQESVMSQNGHLTAGRSGKSADGIDHIQGSSGNPGSSSDFDLTAYDLQAHTLLCAELLNGEGIDRLPEEADADLSSRLWASWNSCKFSSQFQTRQTPCTKQ